VLKQNVDQFHTPAFGCLSTSGAAHRGCTERRAETFHL